ncbi:unnamed protein product [Caenorhabditis brenneri]
MNFLVLNFLLISANAFNVLVYSPSFAGSHTNFMARIADTLTDAGHNVTFLVPVVDEARKSQLGVKSTKDVVIVEQDEEMQNNVQPIDDDMEQYWKTEVDSSNVDTIFSVFTSAMNHSCHNFLRNRKIFEEMKSRNFEVGIFEPLSVCGLGFMHAIGIRKIIIASSCVFYDSTTDVLGEPLDLSYVPGQMGRFEDPERMNLLEKVENYKMSMNLKNVNIEVFDRETKIYKKHLGDSIPDWKQLMRSSSLHFTNSIPFVDFPRTVSPKTIPIGGISVDIAKIKSQKLPQDWDEVLNRREKNMLISFGSLIRSQDMPKEWRTGLLTAIKSLPNVTFIWKYENDDVTWANGVSNIHFTKWVPQTSLLNDPRLTAFMTHGGLGSSNELSHLGKPALMVPVFADQHRNANMLARHGGVIVIQKKDLGDEKKIKSAMKSILFNENFKKNSEKLADLLRNQPLKPKEQVLRYVEFVAKYGPFPGMNIAEMGFVERNLLDIHFIIMLPYVISVVLVMLGLKIVVSLVHIKVVKVE